VVVQEYANMEKIREDVKNVVAKIYVNLNGVKYVQFQNIMDIVLFVV